ncbi:DUF2777 family protein [Salsuginibacillus kocurii]|uniref:DUF2777 family protein n=1 Tax=Salsuginibacillus kocurii TaxID=427078 RepID=UPI0003796894|nr:DUF2777 family protein [Salsuginibacillus kocurii]
MDRKEAKQYEGKLVIVDEKEQGTYIGTLTEVHAPPRKAWSGLISIQGVYSYPFLDQGGALIYQQGDIVEATGSRIHAYEDEAPSSYSATVLVAIEERMKEIQLNLEQLHQYEQKLNEHKMAFNSKSIAQSTSSIHPHTETTEAEKDPDNDTHALYELQLKRRSPVLKDTTTGEFLDLIGCPFELEIQHHDTWVSAYHEDGFTFITEKNERVQATQGATVRIHRQQFDPFQILLNELEAPSKKTLDQCVQRFGFTRKDLSHCHNTLLHQLLQSENETTFSGVNLLIFQNHESTLFIQHLYERELLEDDDDTVYDRFECTTDQNIRHIVTYTNSFTKDKYKE